MRLADAHQLLSLHPPHLRHALFRRLDDWFADHGLARIVHHVFLDASETHTRCYRLLVPSTARSRRAGLARHDRPLPRPIIIPRTIMSRLNIRTLRIFANLVFADVIGGMARRKQT